MAMDGDLDYVCRLTPQIVGSLPLYGALQAWTGPGICWSGVWIQVSGMIGNINAAMLQGNSH
jgi:hypothetical protein